ncbi:type III-A CRISPR-associated RAMP protein Csm5 [Dictyoglomus thermophilum]|uniref:CRISPR system Cms protein Csm5 n=1 Tax=Dictyoglomus thermophilum (strain ATCC 35947 / DSM 3960 / H-6-12) TaxID=309799 RepID=B5YBK3_DICT6|nr:type III-A CRISPR-associated RAMP protein Csm5 [Dictyoglomus thermophilum]ACI18862.1 CRISPR-associated RAMP protein, Csm5 family [Dictyoglomus thermophilum H-6-12]
MKLNITTITPTIVRSGEEISTVSECIIEGDNLYIVNKDKLINFLKTKKDNVKIIEELSKTVLEGQNLKGFLDKNNIPINEVCEPPLKLSERMDDYRRKSVYLPMTSLKRAFIPGSTIKGILRSALLFHYYLSTKKEPPHRGDSKKDNSPYIGEDVLRNENKISTDIMKYVIVRDSSSINFEELRAYKIQRIPHRKLWQIIIAIPPQRKFSIEICIKKDKNYNGPDFWKEFFEKDPEVKLWEYLKDYSNRLIDKELEILENLRRKNSGNENDGERKKIFDDFIKHYKKVKEVMSQKDVIFIPIGFGKTYYFNSLGYFLGSNVPIRRKNVDLKFYPSTRWAVEINEKYYPLGWCALTRSE